MSIHIPCVKGKMRTTEFMLGAMSWAAIANQVFSPDDDRWNDIFEGDGDSEAQRKLNKSRVKNSLVPYLTMNDDAFFSALTLVMVPMNGDELKEGEDYHFRNGAGAEALGELVIEDHVLLFPADGQHRRAGIEGALKQAPGLAQEKVPVVFIPYKGKAGVRQLFSDLNLNAKPPSKTTGYAFEGRDPIVLVTKRLIQELPLLQGRVNLESNSLSSRSAAVVTLNTLVAANTEILAAVHGTAPKHSALVKVPDLVSAASHSVRSAEVEHAAKPLIPIWETFITHTPGWRDILDGKITAGELRDGDEAKGTKGHVSAFGIGWQAVAIAFSAIARSGTESDPIAALVDSLTKVNWQKGSHWNGIAMVGTRINNTGPGIRATAGYLLDQGGVEYPKKQNEDGQLGPDGSHPVGALVLSYLRSRVEAEQEAA